MKAQILLLFLASCIFAYTSGGGTIQQCNASAYDYCTINTSSTIQSTDFVLTNRQTIIAPGASITLVNSRLFINSSDMIWVQANAIIMGSGETNSDPDGGSGGSALAVYPSTTWDVNGRTNGNNGLSSRTGTCTQPDAGEGSGLMPFEYTPGSVGVGDVSNLDADNGGFYATGGVFGSPTGASCAGGQSGGSGYAMKFNASKIQIDGQILADGADGRAGNKNSGAGGSGGGEIVLYAAYINNTGTISASGGDGDVKCEVATTTCHADGAPGGRIKFLTRVLNTSTGTVNISGGVCDTSGEGCNDGANGIANYSKNNTYFQDFVLHLYTQNNSNITSSSSYAQFRLGVFNISNVTCWQNLDGVITSLGTYNYSETQTYDIENPSNGTYTLNITCGNADASIANISTETITLNLLIPESTTTTTTSETTGGGGGGGGGGGTPLASIAETSVPETTEEPPPEEIEELFPDPLTNPEYYTNPPNTLGQSSLFNIADKIVEGSGGTIGSLPYECKPVFNRVFPFVGSEFADKFGCEVQGILSLYIKRSLGFVNMALIVILTLSYWTYTSEGNTKSATPRQKRKFNILLVLTLVLFVLGFDFLAFNLTAAFLLASGRALV